MNTKIFKLPQFTAEVILPKQYITKRAKTLVF